MVYLKKFCQPIHKVNLLYIPSDSILYFWKSFGLCSPLTKRNNSKSPFGGIGYAFSNRQQILLLICFYHLLGEAKICHKLFTISQELDKSFTLSKMNFGDMKIVI